MYAIHNHDLRLVSVVGIPNIEYDVESLRNHDKHPDVCNVVDSMQQAVEMSNI